MAHIPEVVRLLIRILFPILIVFPLLFLTNIISNFWWGIMLAAVIIVGVTLVTIYLTLSD